MVEGDYVPKKNAIVKFIESDKNVKRMAYLTGAGGAIDMLFLYKANAPIELSSHAFSFTIVSLFVARLYSIYGKENEK